MLRKGFLIVGLLAAFVASASAQAVKIGFVDRDAIMETDKVKHRVEKINVTTETAEEEVRAVEDRYFEALKAYRDKEGLFASDEVRSQEKAKVEAIRKELVDFASAKTENLETMKRKLLEEILTEVREIVKAVAVSRGYSIVLWKDTLAYGAEEHDLTKPVVEEFTRR